MPGPVAIEAGVAHLSGVLLPWYNARLLALHREDVLAEAPSWAKPVWKHGGLGEAPTTAPSRVGRCALETIGRVVASQAARREAFVALRAVWGLDDASAANLGPEAPGWRQAEGPEAERLLAAGQPYPVVVQAREAWAGTAPASGLLLGVAEQMAADHRRRTTARWEDGTWAEWAALYGQPAPGPWAEAYTDLQGAPTMGRLLLPYAADDGARAG